MKKELKKFNNVGLTLIELLGVILIISLLMATIYPAVRYTKADYKVEAVAIKMARDLSRAKVYAMMSNSYVRVTFDESFTGRQFYYIWSYNLNFELEESYNMPTEVGFSTNFPSAAIGGEEVRFNQYGRPNRGGTVTVKNEKGEKLYVIVAAVTGRVRVSEYPPWDDY